MEFTLKVTVDLGEKTLKFLTSGPIQAPQPPADPRNIFKELNEKKIKEDVNKPAAATDKKPEPPAKKNLDFNDLDDDAKLEVLKSEVAKHSKAGKAADIKALLTHFGTSRASLLSVDSYDDFHDAIQRYGNGESVAQITTLD